MTVTYELANDITFPHLKIYCRMRDGILTGYRVNTDDGYVMYDPNDNFSEIDPETGEETPVTYYCEQALLPLTVDFNNFPYIVVPRNEVDGKGAYQK